MQYFCLHKQRGRYAHEIGIVAESWSVVLLLKLLRASAKLYGSADCVLSSLVESSRQIPATSEGSVRVPARGFHGAQCSSDFTALPFGLSTPLQWLFLVTWACQNASSDQVQAIEFEGTVRSLWNGRYRSAVAHACLNKTETQSRLSFGLKYKSLRNLLGRKHNQGKKATEVVISTTRLAQSST